MSEADSLSNPPIGADVRQKPWEALGISRATYYRHGKQKPPPREPLKKIAADTAQISGGRYSVRSLQRNRFVQRYGIPALSAFLSGDMMLSRGMIENVAKWAHGEQEVFVDMLIGRLQHSAKIRTASPRKGEEMGPLNTLQFEVGRDEMRKQARDIYAICLAIRNMSGDEFDQWLEANSGNSTEDGGTGPPKK